MRQSREAFPAGLYGMLLVAVFGLTLPSLFAPIERLFVGTAALVPWLVGAMSGKPVAAAAPAVLARLEALRIDLTERVRHHDVHGAESLMPPGRVPVVCGVVSTERRGGAGRPSAVRLDRSYAELGGCLDFVTKGNALLGFVQRPGIGLAADDTAADPALVVLLNDRTSRRIAAAMALAGGGSLRMIVGPSARVDPAALRAELWDDPYHASSMREGGQPVYTLDLPGSSDEPPGNLLLGQTRIGGYEARAGDDPLTIGVFVQPPVDPASLSHVVLWRRATDVVSVAVQGEARRECAAVLWDLPGDAGRHLLAADVAVPDGAAVVQEGLFLGTSKGLSFGMALMTSFPASRQRWSLLLLPDTPAARPRELEGTVERGGAGVAFVRFTADRFVAGGKALPKGYLFTGSNGPHCPSGLLIGSARPVAGERDLIEVTVPVSSGTRAAVVLVQEDAR